MPKTKKIPMRMCIACREMKPKKEMTRVVKNADGEIFFDPTGKAPGRGAYVCADTACIKKMSDKNKLEITATREQMIADGYSPCGTCNP